MTRCAACCAVLLLGVGLAACGSGDSAARGDTDATDAPDWLHDDTSPATESLMVALQGVATCDEALATLKAKLKESMKAELEANREAALASIGTECDYGGYDGYTVDCSADGGWYPEEDTSGGDTGEGASEYSTTNTQVADVDEADFLKNDGNYIYILADGRLQILDAWPADEAHRIGSVAIDGTPRRLFVHDDVAVVYASTTPLPGYDPYSRYYGRSPDAACTYGYDCDFTGDGYGTRVTVWDLSDKSAPRMVRDTTFPGSYIASRRIDDAVYTVIWFPEPYADASAVRYWPDGFYATCEPAYTASQVEAAFSALYEQNLAAIDQISMANALPTVSDRRLVEGSWVSSPNPFGDCAGFYVDTARDGTSLTSVFALDLATEGPLTQTTVVSRPGAIYASKTALYMATRHTPDGLNGWYFDTAEAVSEASTVHGFVLDGGSVGYAGSGVVKGRVLNQFAMDQYQDHLRLATTTGHLPGPAYNTLSVLAQQDDHLALVGQLDHLAPDEDIRAVRFNGDVGFVVTFKKTDPLFVLDLSDPTAPTVKGELKIPGFSTYLHLMDATHILALGYDADDMGDFAYFDGVLLQIFDVSDLANPTLLHKETIGTRGTSSEALTDHLAFTYFKARDALALPITLCEGGGDGRFGDQLTFSGLRVYHVTLADGFSLLGGIPHVTSTGDDYAYCSSWWTEASSLVKRSIFMEDWVFSITPAEIKIASLADLEHPVATLDLTE